MYNSIYHINDYFMKILDTRDLIEKQEGLKDLLVASFDIEDVYSYEDFIETATEEFKDNYLEEIEEIEEIESLLNEIGNEAKHGITLIHQEDFVEYVEEFIKDLGYISKDFPSWIEIDWEATANNVKVDYSEIEYKGEWYYYIA